MVDMDPQQAAEYAQGTGPGEASGQLEGGLQTDTGGLTGGRDNPFGRLFDGDAPGPGVQELQTDYGVDKHLAVALRGVLRTATGSGVPPIFEIGLGGTLTYLNLADGKTSAEDTADGLEDAYGDMPGGPEP